MTNSRMIAWFVWFTASIFYAYQYILRVMPNIMLDDIMNKFDIDATIYGQFSGVYYIGYTLLHLPIGIMLDRFGPRKVMSGCILLSVISLLPLIYADNFIYPIMGRILLGVGSAAAIMGTFKIIRMTFEEKHFTRMLSFSVTIGLLGAIYGGAPVSYMNEVLGYKMVIQIFASLGLLLSFVTYVLVPEIEPEENRGSVLADIKLVFANKKVMALCIFAGFMVGPLEGFADVWASVFLKQVYGFDAIQAAYLPSLFFVGMCFGGPVLSFIAEKTKSYIGVIIGAGILMFVVFAMLVAKLLTVSTITIGFTLVGVACAYQILAIYKASTYVPDHVAGLTTAVSNMIIMSFGYFFHTIIGLIIDNFGGAQSKEAFVFGVSIIPITLAFGVVGFIMIAFHDNKAIGKK